MIEASGEESMNNQSKTINQNKIVIYTRNTSWEQPIGHRLHRNIQVLKDKYERAGYKIGKVYVEPSSNKKTKPVLRQLLEDAANGHFGVVLVWDVFSLTSNGEELLHIEKELCSYDVELCSATEDFDSSTKEGKKIFEYMCLLLRHEHLACKLDINLSLLAKLIINKGKFSIELEATKHERV